MRNNYRKIQEIVAKVFGISVDDVSMRCRKRKYVNARCAFANVMFEKNILRNASEIGRLINRDHATVINSLKNHEDFNITDAYYQKQYKEVVRLVENRVFNFEEFDLMKLFKRIDIVKYCEPCGF